MLSCDCSRYIAAFDWLRNFGRQDTGTYISLFLIGLWRFHEISPKSHDFPEIRKALFHTPNNFSRFHSHFRLE